jgi:hypothetical protein
MKSNHAQKRFTPGQVLGALAVLFLGIVAIAYAVTIPNTFTTGTTISSSQVNANFTALKNAVDPLQVSDYVVFGSLNYTSTNLTATDTKLNTTATSHTFTKSRNDTKIEVHVNSRFLAGTFAGGATGVHFQVRIDDALPSTLVANDGAILTSNGNEFLSLYAVFPGLLAGSHTVSLWASTNVGTSTGASVDSGGWGGKIIVKEVW